MIPKEAIEAAAAAIQVRTDQPLELEDLARAALEAAAPHLMAAALEDAAVDLAKINTGPANWLRSRAGEMKAPHGND